VKGSKQSFRASHSVACSQATGETGETQGEKSWLSIASSTVKAVIYEAFVEGSLHVTKHRARTVHDLYFEPNCEEFKRRTIWRLSNAFTSVSKELDPILNSRRRPSWVNFWTTDCLNCYRPRSGVAGPL
jgi:hypothetical protein